MKIKVKLKSTKASSLMEMVCVIGISVLIGAAIIAGIDFISRFYKKTSSASEARILSSTLTAEVTDELRYAGSFTTDGDGVLTEFFSPSFGKLKGGFRSEKGRIVIGGNSDACELISSAAYTNGLSADIDVKYIEADGKFRVKLSVFSGTDIFESEFDVMPLNAVGE